MSVGEKIAAARKAKGWSAQAVSKWENGQSEPDREHVRALSGLLGLSADSLLADLPDPGWELNSPYFDPEHMYTYVKAKAQAAGLTQTLAALPFMRKRRRA